jgi:heme/copper-type cytochrome/quinol oxidase subunit 2
LYHSIMFFNVRSVSPAAYAVWLRTTHTFQANHPSSIGQLPASLHANQNGTVPSSGNSGSGNTGNTGGILYGD